MGTVGLIGAGNMGAAMARRLLAAGHEVHVLDTRAAAVAPLVERGAVAAASVTEVAEHCRVVLTSLPGPAEVDAVSHELAAVARPGDVHVGHSTVSIESARRSAAVAAAVGASFLDAPVSGGAIGADAGTLAVMASGAASALVVAEPFLGSYADRIVDLGADAGVATLAKLVNNAIFLCGGLVHQEAVVLAAKAGMAPEVIDDVLAASSAAMYLGMASPTLSRRWNGDGFSITLAEKDIALALESARSLAVPMPVTAAAHQHYVRARAAGWGEHVFFGTLAAVEAAAGVEVPARTPAPRPVPAARVAGERYVEHVNAGDLDALVALFADDAVVLHPLGAFAGLDAVRDFYGTNILPHGPVLTASGWVVDGATCVFELAAVTPRGTSNAIDHCTVDASGRVVRMAIAYR
jgi:3-hydroxyisobutyrate dehydrogenase-like beta-hydroxyacid dehydrogenase